MTTDQIILFTLFAAVFGMLLWGRFRYDLVAFAALMVAVVLGVVDSKDAFAGFGHPALFQLWSFPFPQDNGEARRHFGLTLNKCVGRISN